MESSVILRFSSMHGSGGSDEAEGLLGKAG